MNLDQLHPREQIARIMQRIYRFGMTTTSGGNISVRDRDGSIWITPGGVDKGVIGASEIVQVTADGIAEGVHKPSSELPFHLEIYKRRPEVCAGCTAILPPLWRSALCVRFLTPPQSRKRVLSAVR